MLLRSRVNMKKAQVSIEWMMAIGIIFMIFILIYGISIDKRRDIVKSENYIGLKNECYKLAEGITSAFLNGNGTSIYVEIVYDAETDSVNRLIGINGVEYVTCSIPFNQFTATDLNAGTVKLYNQGGFISIANA